MKNWFSISTREDDGPRNLVPLPMGMDDEASEPRRVAQVSIRGPIASDSFWGEEVAKATDFIDALNAAGEVDLIEVNIHSPGGEVFEGWAIYNALDQHPAKVVARVDGLAASMASVIAMAADVIEMPENAHLMIHEVSGGAHGNASDLLKTAELIEQLNVDISQVYENRTGKPNAEIRDMLAAETWMNGKTAQELGFADVVLEPVRAAAITATDLEGLERVPAALVAQALEAVAPTEEGADPEASQESAESAEISEEDAASHPSPSDEAPAGEDPAPGDVPGAAVDPAEVELDAEATGEPEADEPENHEASEAGADETPNPEEPAPKRSGILDLLRSFRRDAGAPGDRSHPGNPTAAEVQQAAIDGFQERLDAVKAELAAAQAEVIEFEGARATAEAVILECLETIAPEVLNEMEGGETTLADLVTALAAQVKQAHVVAMEIVETQVGLTAEEADELLPSPVATDDTPETITIETYNQKTPAEQRAFLNAGGQVTG